MTFFLMTGDDRDRGGDKLTNGHLEDATRGFAGARRSETLILFYVVHKEMRMKA